MNRKLHNSVTAMLATSGLLALSLMAAQPIQPQGIPQAARPATTLPSRIEASTQGTRDAARSHPLSAAGAADIAGLTAQAATLAAMAEAFDRADATRTGDAPVRSAPRRHRGRQSVAMPFFSFFPKG